MADNIDKIIVVALIISAAITAWSVLTPNHLFIG
ncbi:MAG: hypothetical protein PWQ42_583 [Sulfurospirillum sp.]|jgi:hypothetical protein|nr:hypothetical protein [Sulfurospirillum sp.]